MVQSRYGSVISRTETEPSVKRSFSRAPSSRVMPTDGTFGRRRRGLRGRGSPDRGDAHLVDVRVIDVDLADGTGQAGRARLTRHGQPIAEHDLALDVDPGVVGGHSRPDVDEVADDAFRAGAGAERIAIGGDGEAGCDPRMWSEAWTG